MSNLPKDIEKLIENSPLSDKVIRGMNQFIIETHCPFIDELEALFQTRSADTSKDTFTINGYQFDVTTEITEQSRKWGTQWDVSDKVVGLAKWVEGKCRGQMIPIKNLKINMSWCIDYNEDGYQGLHSHGELLSVVFHLDDQPPLEAYEADRASYGMLYSIMPQPDGTQIVKNYIPKRGQCIIMDGKVFHGVYPVKGPRRTVVVDFDFEYLDPDEKIW